MKTTEEKILQVVNLSPDESIMEKITDVHPMKQVAYASVLQACVFGSMIFAFSLINYFLKIG